MTLAGRRTALETYLEGLRASGRKILAPYLTAGFPSPDAFPDLVRAVVDAGADMLEIGIPFSDPIMDGPVIQRASVIALRHEVRPAAAIRITAAVSPSVPFVFMTYVNPVVQMGWDEFARASVEAGSAGTIVPDLPVDEAADWIGASGRHGLAAVFLVAPTTPPERIRMVARAGSGFVYCVSLLGVTGVREAIADTARPLVDRVRDETGRVALLGVGVSTPGQAAEASRFADGVIVGSAVIKAVLDDGPDAAAALVRSMREAMDSDTGPVG